MSSMFSHVLPHSFPLRAIFCRQSRRSVNGVSNMPLITAFDLCC